MKLLSTALLAIITCATSFALDEADITRLIHKLGAADYNERQKATATLQRIGTPARKALEKATKSDDPEVRTRAEQLLNDIRYGINPNWPAELIKQIRQYDSLNPEARQNLLERVIRDYGNEAIPLLLSRIENGEKHDAEKCVELLKKMPDNDAVWPIVLEQVTAPVNEYQTTLLVSACDWSKNPDHISRAIQSEHMGKGNMAALVRIAIQALRDLYKEGSFSETARYAEEYAKAAPAEARFFYLRSLALAKLDKQKEADELAGKAMGMNPDSESAHYTAGQMLMDMGKLVIAEREWKKILEIPPADDVYDINAYMRLGEIYADCDMYESAITMYEEGLEKYKEAKKEHGSSMGMVGADNLSRALEALRDKAKQVGGDNGNVVRDVGPVGELNIIITPTIKNDKADELTKELELTTLRTTVNVQPHGLRLFEKAPATVEYDPKAKQLAVLLNGSPCTTPVKLELKKKETRICLYALDMCYIYNINRDTGKTTKLKSFEQDYTVQILPGDTITSWKESTISLNAKQYTWQELSKGVPFDYLPKLMEIQLKGTTADGKELKLSHKIDPLRYMKDSGTRITPTAITITVEAK